MATSYQELLNVFVAACVSEGWTWADGILNKGNAFIAASYNPTPVTANGSGLQFQGGTGKSNGTLINASLTKVRIGPLNTGTFVPAPSFPLHYHVFIFDNPSSGHISISAESGGDSQSSSYARATGFFWQSSADNSIQCVCQTIYTNVDAIGWTDNNFFTPANRKLVPLISRSPSNWSNEAILLPIEPVLTRSPNKASILAKIENARYLRIENLEPEQVLTLGNDKWMVFPFHKKNSSVPNGGSTIDHSGTFGWAIRYDGP